MIVAERLHAAWNKIRDDAFGGQAQSAKILDGQTLVSCFLTCVGLEIRRNFRPVQGAEAVGGSTEVARSTARVVRL